MGPRRGARWCPALAIRLADLPRRVVHRRVGAVLAGLPHISDVRPAAEAQTGLPRIAVLESEYQRAVLEAEAAWVQSVIADLRSGALTWSRQELLAFADNQER